MPIIQNWSEKAECCSVQPHLGLCTVDPKLPAALSFTAVKAPKGTDGGMAREVYGAGKFLSDVDEPFTNSPS